MATEFKSEKVLPRQTNSAATVRSNPTPSQVAQPDAEPVAQWQDNVGDRVTYLVWMVCFGLMVLYVVVETVLGFLL